jgi:hypothetical protein
MTLDTHETYEQWRRYVWAINADPKSKHPIESDMRDPAREAMIKALGLDRRVPLVWADHVPNPTVPYVAATAVIPKQDLTIAVLASHLSPLWGAGLGWGVSIVGGELAGRVSVSHHPTRDSAVEHFERRLGLYLPQ